MAGSELWLPWELFLKLRDSVECIINDLPRQNGLSSSVLFSTTGARRQRGSNPWIAAWVDASQSVGTTTGVRFGSLTALQSDNTRTAASGCIAAIRWQIFQTLFLNVRFHQERSFNQREIYENEGLLSAISGRRYYRTPHHMTLALGFGSSFSSSPTRATISSVNLWMSGLSI